MKRIDDINDDQLRVIGKQNMTDAKERPLWQKLLAGASAVIAVILVVICIVFMMDSHDPDVTSAEEPETIFEQLTEAPQRIPVIPFGDYNDSTGIVYTEHLVDSINDIVYDVYIPHNAKPRLFVGTPDLNDKNVVFTTQAADIRADNGKIVGAFVLKGEPLTWGLSKKGYCGIIDGQITVGVADNSPLFEEATEKGGYFFRQYPLVNDGVLVENELKGKSIRKALCDRNGQIMVIMTKNPESFHDFAQALVDLVVDNAIYLVGSSSYGYFRDKYDHLSIIYDKRRGGQKYENHIQWVKETLP